MFRGYLSQAIAAWVRRPAVGAVAAALLTAALFSVAHGPPDVATFLDRFAVGLAASAVVWLTGGLEAAIVLHAVNNVVVFVLAGALGDGDAGSDSTGGVGLVPLPLSRAGPGGVSAARGGAQSRTGEGRDDHGSHRLVRGGARCRMRGQVSSSTAPRGTAHGVWGNWQPDGFWFR